MATRDVQVAQFGDLLLYHPLYIAVDEGLFAEQGLEVRIVSTGGDDKTFAAVLSGDAVFGIADPTFPAIARERGASGHVIGILVNGVPNYGVSFEAPPITNPSDLQGRTTATVPAPSTSYALMHELYASAGIDPLIRQMTFPGLIPALRAGDVDYSLLIEPWVSQIEAEGGHVAFSLMDYYEQFALTGITTTAETVSGHREIVDRFLKGLIAGVDVFYNSPERALRVAEARFPDESTEVLRTALARMRSDSIFPVCLDISPDAWRAAVDLRVSTGDLLADSLADGIPMPDLPRAACN